MKYQLQEGEEVLMELKPAERAAWYFMISRTWHFLLVIVVLGVWTLMVSAQNPEASHSFSRLLNLITQGFFQRAGLENLSNLVFIVFLLLILGLMYVYFLFAVRGYSYVVTNQRLIISYGFIVLNHRIIPLEKINDLNMNATLFERMFGLGSVYIATLGTLFSGFNGSMNNRGGLMGTNRSGFSNNTTRLECLSLAQCDEVMAVISKAMKQVGIKA